MNGDCHKSLKAAKAKREMSKKENAVFCKFCCLRSTIVGPTKATHDNQ